MQPINFTNLVDVRDVWMIQRGRGFRFTNETFHPVAIRSHIRRKNFQRNFAIEFRVLRQIHLTHPARAEFAENPVMGDRLFDHRVAPSPNSRW